MDKVTLLTSGVIKLSCYVLCICEQQSRALSIHSPWFIKTSQPGLNFQRLLKETLAIFKDSFTRILGTSKISFGRYR